MTEAEIELGMKAATVFKDLFPDAWKHDNDEKADPHHHCKKCEKHTTYGVETGFYDTPCTVPTPIDINDWNVAHKLVRECDHIAIRKSLAEIYERYRYNTEDGKRIYPYDIWTTHHATPSDYTKAAIKAKEAENETN